MRRYLASAILFTLILVGCGSHPPIKTESFIDLPRFMGKWYVIANIPTFIEKEAHNASETYTLNDDGTVSTHFQFQKGSFDGESVSYFPTGYVLDESNAVWKMQFLWPFKSDFRIVFVDSDYHNTIIGRPQRDYIWIMSRQPIIDESVLNDLKKYVSELGYDIKDLQVVPQQPKNSRRI